MRPDREPGSPPGRALRFTVATVNRGEYRLDILGLPQPGGAGLTAWQCVRWVLASPVVSVCAERVEAGRIVWHPEHSHWHFEDFARYELRDLVDGEPDMTPGGLVAGGNKVSFCLQDTDREDPASINDPLHWLPPAETFVSQLCPGVHQGISPGWRDVYSSSLWGQQVPIDGVADGVYALVVRLNPQRRLAETTSDDDVAVLVVRLSDGGQQVKVVEP